MLIWFGERNIKIVANFDVDDAYPDVLSKLVVQFGYTSPISKVLLLFQALKCFCKCMVHEKIALDFDVVDEYI